MIYRFRKYSLELPDKWRNVVSVKETRSGVVFRELMEEEGEHSGVVAVLKTLKRRRRQTDDTELIGRLYSDKGEAFYLYAVYGGEDDCSEDNAELFCRIIDGLYPVFRSIRANEGYSVIIE